MSLAQDPRYLAIATPLGRDVLAVRSISVNELLGRLFQIEAELLSEDGEITFDDILGQNVTIRFFVADNEPRFFNGFVSRFVQETNRGGLASYRAIIVPWLWFLTRTADCRIFQGKSVPEIIEAVFKGHGFGDFEIRLSGNYEAREFCVQYRETDFDFVSRLMEEEGIYYFFEHSEGKHVLVLADSISAHNPFPGYAKIVFRELERGAAESEEITDWTMETAVQPVAYAMNDFDPLKSKTSLLASASISRTHGGAKYEIYDYPGEYWLAAEGTRLSDVRLAELQSLQCTARGAASARGIACGSTFHLVDHPRSDQNKDYLVTAVTLFVESGEYASDRAGGSENAFSCHFSVLDVAQQFRAARSTPRPVVQGPQTAIVVGPGGEEIHTDQHGRVKLQFHWDRYGKADGDSSCWVRVSQGWAGKHWGAVTIPRIGQEVIVEFLEGDPDRPIITGRVYNADHGPPYGLPASKTRSGVKSRSSPGGDDSNFNEIRFEDKKGGEQVYIHAEKNQDNVVENDETTDVGNDRTEKVGHDEKITIGNNRTEDVGQDEKISIGGNRTETVAKDETISISGNRTESVSKKESITIGDSRTESVGKDETIAIAQNRTETVGKDETVTVSGNRTHKVAKDESVSVSQNRTVSVDKNDTLKVGKKLAITAGDEISITTGKASIVMKKDGTISITGKDIKVEGSGAINVKASKDVVMKGKKILQN